MTTRLYLPDTNALSRFLRADDTRLRDRFIEHAADIRLSAIVWHELRYGADKRPDLPWLEERLDRLRRILPEVEAFDEEAAWHAGRARAMLANLRPNALPIGPSDILIAGHALALGAVLVTQNVSEFSRVPGLSIEDWQDSS